MEIHIDPNQTVSDLKKAFHERFKNLKINFFYHDHKAGEGSPKADMVPGDTVLATLMDDAHEHEGDLTYKADMPIRELESLFHDKFGLNVQVFRFAGHAWLETMSSDTWTLQKANDYVKELYEDR